jgi:MoaA/NifB/PqqE/SkfB family radical SAM enzyme
MERLKTEENQDLDFSSEKLILFPERVAALRQADLSLFPVSVELSLTTHCNLKCAWCVDLKWREDRPGILDKSLILKVMKELKSGGTRGITIEGGGEPTIHPDFREIVEGILDSGLAVGLITNGIAFKDFDLVERMSWIRFSIDAGTKYEFSKLKGGREEDFDKVLENIKRASAAGKGKCRIGAGFIITPHNLFNLIGLTQSIRGFGARYIQFRRPTEADNLDLGGDFDLSELKSLETPSFEVYIHQMKEYSPGNFGLPCVAHSLTTVIGADGGCFVCCRLRSPVNKFMGCYGNLKDAPFGELWRGEARQEMSKKLLDGNFCKAYCPECRLTKYNLLIERLNKTKTVDFL